ncbi:DDE-type integrase/transposase/recombinase [Candidatus Bipolaricaulota bacterium]|nr:DDE-type integrase/transposase/recombinase [Candidatus Bipolaricaulota bacterium]
MNVTLKAAGLPKSTYYYHRNEKVDYEEKYRYLKPKLNEIIDEHPGYGRDKIKTELEENHGLTVNHKVITRLLRFWEIKLARTARSTEPSPVRQALTEASGDLNLVEDLNEEEIGLFDVLYTDFTEIRYGNGKVKAWLIPVIGHRSKLIFGWAVGKSPTTEVALTAWSQTRETFNNFNASLEGTILHQDQDSVFTSNDWVDETLIEESVQLSYSENGAKGNVYMESFNGHFKCPNKSLFCEAESLEELRVIVEDQVNYWNNRRRHASLQNRIPIEYIEEEIQDES